MAFDFNEQLGFSPPFQFTQTQEEGFYTDVINYQRLADTLIKYQNLLFDYKEFISNKTFSAFVKTFDGPEPRTFKTSVPLVVPTEDGGQREISISGRLNKREARVALRKGKVRFGFQLQPNKYAKYTKKILYEFSNEVAIELTTFTYEDYVDLGDYINFVQNPNVEALINRKFNEAFTKTDGDISTLKWLYENAPPFTLKQRGDDKLIADLEKLITYDKESWFKDASTAILNLITGFNDLKLAYDYFHDAPERTIAIYDVLDSASQQQFCVLLNVLCYAFTPTKRRSSARFVIGKDFTLNSNIFLDDNQKEILLEQSEIFKREVEVTSRDEFGVEDPVIIRIKETPIPVVQQTQFHPLDMVSMVDQASGEEKLVCALNVKLLSDQAEWEFVINTTVLVISVIAILVSAGTLAAGATGLTAALAVAEIVVATIDIAAILNNASLKETEEGKWFLEHWNTLSAATGVLSLSAAIRQGLLKNGPKLLAGVKKLPNSARVIQLRKVVTQFITSLQIEFYFIAKQGFAFCTIVPFPNVPKLVGKAFATKMEKFGVLISEPIEAGSDIRALIYNGEKIAEGSIDDIKATLKEVFPFGAKDSDVVKVLDELASTEGLNVTFRTFLTKRGLKIVKPPRATKNFDIVDDIGNILFRGTKSDMQKYVDFMKKLLQEREAIIDTIKKELKGNTKFVYDPELARAKGYDVPMSANGTSPDFEGLQMYLNDGKLGNGLTTVPGVSQGELADALRKIRKFDGQVKINITGVERGADFRNCWRAMGIEPSVGKKISSELDLTWHHLDDLDPDLKSTMQLVLGSIHRDTLQHMGSHIQIKKTLDLN